MGKGKETKNPDILSAGTHLAKKEKKSGKLKKIGVALLAIVIIAAVVGLNVYNYVIDTGFFARRTVAVSTENYSLTSAQMSYYFYSQYQNMYTMYTYYGLDMSSYIDSTTSLKLQKCTFSSEDGTWFDYFMTGAVETASQMLTLCEAAKAEGITLDDADYDSVNSTIEQLKETAKNEGYSLKDYIKNNYGPYVTENDLRSAVELQTLANKYTEKCTDEVDTSDEKLEEIYTESPDDYDTVSYLSYTFDYSDIIEAAEEAAKESDDTADTAETSDDAAETEVDSEAKAAAVATAKEYADRLAAVTDEEGYKSVIREYLISELLMTEEEADDVIEAEGYVVEDAAYSSSDEQSEWAFAANVGEVKLFEETEDHEHEEDDDHSDLASYYTVLMLTKARGRNESISSRDVRHILFSKDNYEDNTKAKEVYDKWVADGAKLEDFEALVKEYSDDPGSVATGGLYEGVTEGQMVEEFENWLFDESRAEGDHGLVESADHGWHIMYYEGGIEGWKAQIITELEEEAVNTATEAAAEAYSVNVDNEALDEIPA